MSASYTPWSDRAKNTPEPEDAMYGVSRSEIAAMRAHAQELLDNRDSTEVLIQKMSKHLRNVGTTTARKASRSMSIRLSDARHAIARLVDVGKVVRDGDLWEEAVGQGDRYAAAYKWIGPK